MHPNTKGASRAPVVLRKKRRTLIVAPQKKWTPSPEQAKRIAQNRVLRLKAQREKAEALKARRDAASDKFFTAFPLAKKFRPLKVGVRKDVKAAGFTNTEVKDALLRYTRNVRYLKALAKPDAWRYDLITGEPTEPVNEQNRQDAVDKLAERKEFRK